MDHNLDQWFSTKNREYFHFFMMPSSPFLLREKFSNMKDKLTLKVSRKRRMERQQKFSGRERRKKWGGEGGLGRKLGRKWGGKRGPISLLEKRRDAGRMSNLTLGCIERGRCASSTNFCFGRHMHYIWERRQKEIRVIEGSINFALY